MISYSDITKLFSFDLKGKYCIEIEFSVKDHPKYQYGWMGKMPDKTIKKKELFWFGLVPEGSNSYDYDSFEEFSSAPVFDGKSLNDIWDEIEILSIDSCDPDEQIATYL